MAVTQKLELVVVIGSFFFYNFDRSLMQMLVKASSWIMFTVGNGDVMSTAMSTAISVDTRSI